MDEEVKKCSCGSGEKAEDCCGTDEKKEDCKCEGEDCKCDTKEE